MAFASVVYTQIGTLVLPKWKVTKPRTIFAGSLKRFILIPDFFPNAETHYRTQFRNLIKLIIPHSSQQMKK